METALCQNMGHSPFYDTTITTTEHSELLLRFQQTCAASGRKFVVRLTVMSAHYDKPSVEKLGKTAALAQGMVGTEI